MERAFERKDGETVEKALMSMEVKDVIHFPFSLVGATTIYTFCSNINRVSDRTYRARRLDEIEETLVIRVE